MPNVGKSIIRNKKFSLVLLDEPSADVMVITSQIGENEMLKWTVESIGKTLAQCLSTPRSSTHHPRECGDFIKLNGRIDFNFVYTHFKM